MSKTPLLDTIKFPADLRRVPESDLRQIADELRTEMIDAVSVTGGHLGAGLGVVELTVALHWVFETPRDRLIWDVGHQTYPHKILTGRRDRIRTLRQPDGLSGFTRRAESEYDAFGAGHSSTSISAGLGMAVARDLNGGDNNVVAVIGDGAMSAGMAYEAMNNAGARDERLIVILNDNDMSIAPPTGALSSYLARITSSGTYLYVRDIAKQLAKKLPKSWERRAARVEEYTRHLWQGGAWFEELGFYYIGPIDGHDFNHLLPVLKNVRDAKQGPILVHVVTRKGKGYGPAEESDDKYHGVSKFNVVTGAQVKAKSNAPSYTKVFAEGLIAEARKAVNDLAAAVGLESSTSFGRRGEIDPLGHLLGIAGWAGQPATMAEGIVDAVDMNDGKTPHVVTVRDVPVDAFWSITVYDADGFLAPNDLNRNSYNNTSATPNDDGSYTIHFGGDPEAKNYLPITEGWSYTIRLYKPRKEILNGSWIFPAIKPSTDQ